MMEKKKIWKHCGSDIMAGIGAVLLTAGVCMIYVPAGMITAGLLLLAVGAVLSTRGDDDG